MFISGKERLKIISSDVGILYLIIFLMYLEGTEIDIGMYLNCLENMNKPIREAENIATEKIMIIIWISFK